MRRDRYLLLLETPQQQQRPHHHGSCDSGLFASASTGNVAELLRGRLRQRHWHNTKSVLFDRIEILEFPVELGDHPCVSLGVPIQIGWIPTERRTWEIERYELLRLREGKRPRRCNIKERSLAIPAAQRREWLRTKSSAKYTDEEIEKATKAARRAKERRERSAKRREWDGWMWAIEKTGRSLRKVANHLAVNKSSSSSFKAKKGPSFHSTTTMNDDTESTRRS
jgi:hypothetical protein